tara:strand:- start:1854 stop:3131 length:1278 start_codon:yes stop_codon:yes gene_type:complete
MNTSNILRLLNREARSKTAVVITRCPEFPLTELSVDLSSIDTDFISEVSPSSTTLTFIPAGAKHIKYLRACCVSMEGENTILLYESDNQTSAFTYLVKSIDNINNFKESGIFSDYKDLVLNFQSLLRHNTFNTAKTYIENSIGLPIEVLANCEVQSLSAFQETLYSANLCSRKTTNKDRNQRKPAANKNTDKAKPVLHELRKQVAPVEFPRFGLKDVKDTVRCYMYTEEMSRFMQKALVGLKNRTCITENSKQHFEAFTYNLFDVKYTQKLFEEFVEALAFYSDVHWLVKMNLFTSIIVEAGSKNFAKRKGFEWHTFQLNASPILDKLLPVNRQLKLEEGVITSRFITTNTVLDGSNFEITVNFVHKPLQVCTVENDTGFRVKSPQIENREQALALALEIFKKSEAVIGTIPAMYLVFNSIYVRY